MGIRYEYNTFPSSRKCSCMSQGYSFCSPRGNTRTAISHILSLLLPKVPPQISSDTCYTIVSFTFFTDRRNVQNQGETIAVGKVLQPPTSCILRYVFPHLRPSSFYFFFFFFITRKPTTKKETKKHKHKHKQWSRKVNSVFTLDVRSFSPFSSRHPICLHTLPAFSKLKQYVTHRFIFTNQI